MGRVGEQIIFLAFPFYSFRYIKGKRVVKLAKKKKKKNKNNKNNKQKMRKIRFYQFSIAQALVFVVARTRCSYYILF